MPPGRFHHRFEHDVFLSYAHVDDDVDPSGRRWVSQFAEDLKNRLQMVAGRSIAIWRDDRLGAADRFDSEIQKQLAASAVLLPILSPAYFVSDFCRREREEFIRAAGDAGLHLGNKARIVKVAKTRVDRNHYPPDLLHYLEHRFYIEEANGSHKEFHLHGRPEVRDRYATLVDDVAQEVSTVLSRLETLTDNRKLEEGPKRAVYLAFVTGDIEPARQELRRLLEQRGHEVLPTQSFSLDATRIRDEIRSSLARAAVAIFPLGRRYGWSPEQGDGKSVVQLQLEEAAVSATEIPRIVWILPHLRDIEPAQHAMLETARRQYPALGFEIVEAPLQALETHLQTRIAREKTPSVAHGDDEPPRVYLMCDRCDRDQARNLRQYLIKSGIQVDLLPDKGEPTQIGQLHREWLLSDDAFLVYYGASDEVWVARQEMELRKARGFGRLRAALSRIVLVPPESADKEDRRLAVKQVLDGLPPRELAEAVSDFLMELHAGRSIGPLQRSA
jgi:hypothetical protein